MRSADLTPEIIGAAIRVHRRLGPGLLESAYEACLAFEIQELGLRVERQKAVPLIYQTVKLDCGFRADNELTSLRTLRTSFASFAVKIFLAWQQKKHLTAKFAKNVREGR